MNLDCFKRKNSAQKAIEKMNRDLKMAGFKAFFNIESDKQPKEEEKDIVKEVPDEDDDPIARGGTYDIGRTY